jgi:hypothetical protein
MADVISSKMKGDFDVAEVDNGGMGDQHVWLIVYDKKRAYEVDIPPSVYESGGGYTWKKQEGVKFSEDDISITPFDRDLVDGMVGNFESTDNVFCATGKGGGKDPTCGKGGKGSAAIGPDTKVKKIKEGDVYEDDVDGWSEGQKNIALGVIESIKEYPTIVKGAAVRDEKGSLAALMSYVVQPDGDVYVEYLSSNRKGGGTRLIAEACKEASKNRTGVTLDSVPEAKSFYEHIGMKELPKKKSQYLTPYSFTL